MSVHEQLPEEEAFEVGLHLEWAADWRALGLAGIKNKDGWGDLRWMGERSLVKELGSHW